MGDEAMGSFICKYYHGTNEMCMIASITNVTSMAIDTYRSANLRLGPDNFKDFPPKRRTTIFLCIISFRQIYRALIKVRKGEHRVHSHRSQIQFIRLLL